MHTEFSNFPKNFFCFFITQPVKKKNIYKLCILRFWNVIFSCVSNSMNYIWSGIVPYSPVWSCMFLYGPALSCMVPHGPLGFLKGPYGPVWFCMVTYGPIWSCMALYGPVWSHMVPYGPVWLGLWLSLAKFHGGKNGNLALWIALSRCMCVCVCVCVSVCMYVTNFRRCPISMFVSNKFLARATKWITKLRYQEFMKKGLNCL